MTDVPDLSQETHMNPIAIHFWGIVLHPCHATEESHDALSCPIRPSQVERQYTFHAQTHPIPHMLRPPPDTSLLIPLAFNTFPNSPLS